MFGYHVPAPDQAMLISGGKNRAETPFRVVTGHGAFVLPLFRKVRFLTLAMCEAEVEERCVQAGNRPERARGNRLQGRQRLREHCQCRTAFPL